MLWRRAKPKKREHNNLLKNYPKKHKTTRLAARRRHGSICFCLKNKNDQSTMAGRRKYEKTKKNDHSQKTRTKTQNNMVQNTNMQKHDYEKGVCGPECLPYPQRIGNWKRRALSVRERERKTQSAFRDRERKTASAFRDLSFRIYSRVGEPCVNSRICLIRFEHGSGLQLRVWVGKNKHETWFNGSYRLP